MSLGRFDDGTTAKATTDFESFVEIRVAERFKAQLRRISEFSELLRAYKASRPSDSHEDFPWMGATADMAAMAFDHWRQREAFIRELHRGVKIWCFTVDGFLKTKGGN
jgi:hypothetical protein